MKRKTFLLGCAIAFAWLSTATAQSVVYTDYQQYFSDMKMTPPGAIKTVQDLQNGASRLRDEAPLNGRNISLPAARRKVLAGEDIYARRKSGVFMVGKLKKAKNGPASITFDITGTAFAISMDGVCVTNYHVLKSIITNDRGATEDSAYFIVGSDRQVYFIDSILACSQNNDLAIFKVNTSGGKLDPIPLGKPAQVGAAVYCISHPVGHFYYFSTGIVARNVAISGQQSVSGYNPEGRPPIRMQITADYGVGSSGGPVLDKYGNLVGVVSSTAPVGSNAASGHQQMVVRETSPVNALRGLLEN